MALELPGGFDGIIKLNTSTMNLSRASNNPSKYDLLSVAEHEMDEVLGLGSDWTSQATDYTFPQDLFRYTAAGARTFTRSGDDAYFSLDGTNFLVQFNQASNGDYGDWWSTGVPHAEGAGRLWHSRRDAQHGRRTHGPRISRATTSFRRRSLASSRSPCPGPIWWSPGPTGWPPALITC